MPITVRVREFQSIEDATVVLDGFTVITGANNSGKTALVRAIRGVFTNAPAGPLVRHGAAHLTVEIDFQDGNTVKWEKGWEKPGQKGKTVNRYTVNGQVLPSVGRGCPPEVLELGIRSIRAGTDTLWPQIADQFRGVLFLVGSPGSATAEAIANVERVGVLTAALKLCESDQRKARSKLGVRREDETQLVDELGRFDGLDIVEELVVAIGAVDQLRIKAATELGAAMRLRKRLRDAQGAVDSLQGIDAVTVPSAALPNLAVGARDGCQDLRDLRDRVVAAQRDVNALAGIAAVDLGRQETPYEAVVARGDYNDAQVLHERLTTARRRLVNAEAGASVCEAHPMPEPKQAVKVQAALRVLGAFRERRDNALTLIADLAVDMGDAETALAEAAETVRELLGGMDECPTCGSALDHVHVEAV